MILIWSRLSIPVLVEDECGTTLGVNVMALRLPQKITNVIRRLLAESQG